MRILIVKIGAIGDVVMALPLLPVIRKKHPDAYITWIAGKLVSGMLAETRLVDEIIEVEEAKLLKGNALEKANQISTVWKKIAFRKFDLILYYYYSEAYKILILPTFSKEIRWFTRKPEKRTNPLAGRHHSYEYIQTFEQQNGATRFPIKFPAINSELPENLVHLSQFRKKKRIAFSCGGAKNILREDDLRRWPIDRYVALAKHLLEMDCEILLTGSPSDSWVLPHFEHLPVQSFVGKVDLLPFISLLKTCDLMVTHDSGPLHLADLAGIPSVGLFGPTPAFSFKSLQSGSETIEGGSGLSCRPCYDGKDYAICQNAVCMEDIEVENVLQKVKSLLSRIPLQVVQ